MAQNERLITRLEGNEDAFFSLWCDLQDLGEALILTNRHFSDDPLFNHVTRMDSHGEAMALISSAIDIFGRQGIPPCFYISPLTEPRDLAPRLVGQGFHLYDRLQVMKRGPVKESRRAFRIDEVGRDGDEAWCNTFSSAFDIPPHWHGELRRRVALISDLPEAKLCLAHSRDGIPVGCLALFHHKGTLGVYCVGTIPSFRGRGVATALIKKADEVALDEGADTICLQTLDKGGLEDFYTRRGFELVYGKEIYIMASGS